DQIGFTVTVYNTGTGDANGVNLLDPLPANAGLNWTIQNQGSGWSGSCAIALGAVSCGPVTVPAGTTKAASTFTVRIISPTTAATLSDPLPANAGLNWSIDNQGTGWASTCAIAAGTLTCGGVNGVTVPFATTQVGSSYTVHITSGTTAATGGVCPGGSGVVDN